MRILFLAQVLPYPLDAGPKVRAYYVLRYLAERHRVTLVAFVRPSDPPAARAHLEAICEQVITCPMPRSRVLDLVAAARSLASGRPFLITRDRVPAMYARLRALLAEQPFDAIHADQLWMAPYALAARSMANHAGAAPHTVLDQHNAVYLVPERLASSTSRPYLRPFLRWEAARLRAYERAACLAFDHVVTLTEQDRAALLRLYPDDPRPNLSAVIPICVDADLSPPVHYTRSSEPVVLFLGGMHWPPNAAGVIWFAREIWPRIQRQVPTAQFWAVGRNPPAALAATGELRINTPGFVDDPQPCWGRAQAFVVPLLAGGGMRVKILDAWARGVPVVSTTIGAEGLHRRHGEDILVADSPAAFAEAVARILTDEPLARRLISGGRATLEQYYLWRATYPAWDAIYSPHP